MRAVALTYRLVVGRGNRASTTEHQDLVSNVQATTNWLLIAMTSPRPQQRQHARSYQHPRLQHLRL
jgi:hypothetical protein